MPGFCVITAMLPVISIALLAQAGPDAVPDPSRLLRKSHTQASSVCRCLLELRRQSEKLGYLKFDVRLAVNRHPDADGGPEAGLAATIDRGVPYRLRRLDFFGNRRISGRAIRANMLLDENDLLDLTLLRKSLANLNHSGWFEPVDEQSITLFTDPATGLADIGIQLRERRARLWSLSGPLIPSAVAGSFQFAIASRMPSWGRGIIELSTYYLSFHLVAAAGPVARIISGSRRTVLPAVAVRRPFSPGEGWKSGFAIAPQLGWRPAAAGYGMTQMRERLFPRLAGDRVFTPAMPVVMENLDGERVLLCKPQGPSLRWLRAGAGVALEFASAFSGILP